MSLPNFDIRRGSDEIDTSEDAAAVRRISRRRNEAGRTKWQQKLGLDPTVTGMTTFALITHASCSILFLVFLNSVQPFYISQLADGGRTGEEDDDLGQGHKLRIGLLTGKLVFADELISIFLVLGWGALADRIGVGLVAAIGYCLISCGFFIYSLATEPWPQLLWARLVFASGASAVTAMLTGSLVAFSDSATSVGSEADSAQIADSDERTPLLETQSNVQEAGPPRKQRHGRLASIAGILTGVGAILAVFFLLPLPVWLASIHDSQSSPETQPSVQPADNVADANVLRGTREAFSIVGVLALLVAAVVGAGLRGNRSKRLRSRRSARSGRQGDAEEEEEAQRESGDSREVTTSSRAARRARLRSRQSGDSQRSVAHTIAIHLRLLPSLFGKFLRGFKMAWHDRSGRLSLAYLGGALARGVTIGSTVFLPLLISHYFYTANPALCPAPQPGLPPSELKKLCRQAYTLTSAQSGVLQTVSLIFAPLVGWSSDRFSGSSVLLLGSLAGLLGFLLYGVALPAEGDPRTAQAWIAAVLLGITQIAAIVASLAIVAGFKRAPASKDEASALGATAESSAHTAATGEAAVTPEAAGAIAGAYSSLGALTILLLSSIGGWLFDLFPQGPFCILAGLAGVVACWSAVVSWKEVSSSKSEGASGRSETGTDAVI